MGGQDGSRQLVGRRAVIAAGLAAAGAAVLPAAPAGAAPAAEPRSRSRGTGRRIPVGYARVDPRTAERVPLTLSLREGVPLYPGDPEFTWEVVTDTRTPQHDDGGYLLERITSLGTHTASHISAPVHFIIGGRRMSQLDEDFTLMPLAVIDVRGRIRAGGPDFVVTRRDLQRWERRHGRIPAGGCVLLLTGYARLFYQGSGEDSPYVSTPAPGFAGEAVDWLFAAPVDPRHRLRHARPGRHHRPHAAGHDPHAAARRHHPGERRRATTPDAAARRLDRRQRQPAAIQRVPDWVHRIHAAAPLSLDNRP